jgi:vacuolar iron transporter family protein
VIVTGLGAAVSSFCFFACGALIPVLPYLIGPQGRRRRRRSGGTRRVALVGTGVIVGRLSGGPPLRRALRH